MRMSRSKLPLLSHSAKFLLLGGAFVLGASPTFAQGSTDPFAPPPALPIDDQALPASQGQDDAFTFEKTPEELEEEARDEAFNAALQGLLPLRPEEIRTLLERFDRTQESVSIPIYPDPKPEVTVQHIPLDPGVVPVTVKTAYGHVTTINILDSTGAEWPIEDITWAGDFEVVETQTNVPETLPNILRITPQSEYATGNMSIKLIDLPTPIIIRLDTSRDIVHYRFDAVIPEVGPFGKVPIIDSGITINAGGQDMTSILEGVIPPGAERLNVSGADSRTRAYDYGGLTILRTPFSLLSPAWQASASSADGTNVYAFQQTPVVLLSENGKMLRVRISSRGDILDE